MLSAYQYDIQFRPTGEHCNADSFSHLPVVVPEPVLHVAPSSVFNLMQVAHVPVNAGALHKATRMDSLISRVVKYTLTGWPSTVEPELKPYWTKRMELTVEAGCLLWGMRVYSCSSNLSEESIGRASCQSPEDEVPGTYTCVVAWNRCRYRETRSGV